MTYLSHTASFPSNERIAPSNRGIKHLKLGRGNADALRDVVRDYAIKHLGTDDAVLRIGETVFLKQGKTSCGMGRQYTRSAGKVTNCQIGVFAAYVSAKEPCFHQPGIIPAEKLGQRPGTAGDCACPREHDFRDQAGAGGANDRMRDSG